MRPALGRAGVTLRLTGKALELLQQCTEHTPTLIELYTVKAKILKHAGDVEGAAAATDKARSMDLADRWAVIFKADACTAG